MLSNNTFRSMMSDFIELENTPALKWRYEKFVKNLKLIIEDPDDFNDAIKYMHHKKDHVDTIVCDWIIEAMCKTLID